ncbi:MAG: hypothetical protein ACTSRI_16180 [Promethearchaeota archaeon]
MENNNEKSVDIDWKDKVSDHWKALILLIAAIVVLSIVAVIVLIWHIQTSPIGAYGTATFDQWSLDWIVGFAIVLILWELLFIGLPGGLFFGLGVYLWWKRLPADEKTWFKEQEKKSHKKRNAGGGCGLLFFIAYCIYIAIDGNYSAAFGSQPYSYWVYSYLLMIGWLLIIVGIPGIILCVLYFIIWKDKINK